MEEIKFEWNEEKNEINKFKHGIDFHEAKTVFYDDNAILFDDPEHSVEEERFMILGITEHENLCIVSHCYRGGMMSSELFQRGKQPKTKQGFITDMQEVASGER